MKVSVVIPCYNVEPYIEECLKSVSSQTHSDLEVICVDDGSTDSTLEVISRLTKELSIIVIEQDNQGAPAARNTGISRATGEYIQFLDADDRLHPEKIESQIQRASQSEWPDIIVGGYVRQDEAGEELERRSYAKSRGEDHWLMLMKTDLGITSSNLFNATSFRNGLRWNENLGSSQEYELMFQIMKRGGTLEFGPGVLTTITRRSAGSISQKNLRLNWRRYIELRVRIMDFIKEKGKSFPESEGYQVIFDSIRTLYPHDPKGAIELHDTLLPSTFSPSPSLVTGKDYIIAYKAFGFRGAELLAKTFRKARG